MSADNTWRMRAAAASIERIDPASAVARSCIARYFAELGSRVEGGFDHVRSITTQDEELRPPAGAFLVAMADGEPLACGAVTRTEPGVGSIKRMWVAADARGLGFGRRMLGALEEQARELGISIVRLETNRSLTEAIALYRSAGYEEVAPFNAEPYAHHWFEKKLG